MCMSSVLYPVDVPDAGEGMCCDGAAMFGPDRCTCWTRVHDFDQAQPDEAAEPEQRPRMCSDCAYRPDSPEKRGDDGYAGNPAELERTAIGSVFWCHDGMRHTVGLRHPSGATVPVDHDATYDPPVIDGQPYRADGRPALKCAGWAARRKALLASMIEVHTMAEADDARISRKARADA